MKSIYKRAAFRFAFIGLICFAINAKAQMPNDAVYMPKNTICVVASVGISSWKEYWENTLKRENFNMGTLTNQQLYFDGSSWSY